jgi:hypothetical protein
MKTVEDFFTRNQDYIKHSDVPKELIDKYIGVLPDAILEVWRRTGFGIYEHGFIQFVNPDDYKFMFRYIDVSYNPAVVFGITALGDLLIFYGDCKIGIDGGNFIVLTFVNDCDDECISGGDIGCWLGRSDVNLDPSHMNYNFWVKEYRSVNYHRVKGLLPALQYGECYCYAHIPALGGKKSYKGMYIGDAQVYLDLIGQATGKIIDYGHE